MPQTREHLDILTLLGIEHGIVALTKIDRVEPELLEIVQADLRDYLEGTFLADAPILPVSSVTGEGLGPFATALGALVRSIEPKRADGVFRVPVDRSFSVKGYGTVVAGIPVSGSARVGDEIVLLPHESKGRIKAVQVYGRDSDAVLAGQCAAINVRDWDHRTIGRGHIVTMPGFFSPAEWYVCRLRLLPHEKLSLKNGARIKFHTGTSEVQATIYLMQANRMGAGEEGFIQVRLADPIVAGPGDHFIVRTPSPVRTIGGGIIIEATPRRLKRNRPEVIPDLTERAAAVASDAGFVEYCIKTAEGIAANEADLARRAKVLSHRLHEILENLLQKNRAIRTPAGAYIHTETAASAGQRLVALVSDFHEQAPDSPGPTFEDVQASCGIDRTVLKPLVTLLMEQGRLVERHHRLALPDHREPLGVENREFLDAVEAMFRNRPFQPPSLEDVVEQTGAPKDKAAGALKILVEHERLVRVEGDLLFHADAVERARELLVEFIKKEGRLESVKFKYLIDTTRKYAIPLLDYFDKINVTRRAGNTRYLR